jgi:CheY-like chemotaxis protein
VGFAAKVLLVDDEPLVLRTTAELLSEGGCEVSEATCYDEALARLEGGTETDVLVTDISLSGGGQDGIALARSVAERWPDIRIVIVSGRVRPTGNEYPESAIFFTKPYAPGALLTLVKDCADW